MTDHAHELRRYARKIAHPAGDVPAVMLAAADEIGRLQSVITSVKAIENSMDGFRNNSEWADGYIQAVKDIADGIRARGDA